MPSRPTLSVIVPMLNVGAMIGEAVGSVLGAAGVDLEVLVVDDGSEDQGPEIARELARRDPRVRFFGASDRAGERLGSVSAARNFGLERSRGRYVMFLDGDDAVEPDGPARLIACAERERASGGCPAASGPAAMCDERLRPLGRRLAHGGPRLGEERFLRACCVGNGAHVLARELIGKERFDPGFIVAEDWDLWLRLSERGVEWTDVAGPSVSRYRMRPGSATRGFRRVAGHSRRVVENAAERRRRGLGTIAVTSLDVLACRARLDIELATRLALSGVSTEECVAILEGVRVGERCWTPQQVGALIAWSVMCVFCRAPDEQGPVQDEWLDRIDPLMEPLSRITRANDVGACWQALAKEMAGPARVAALLLDRVIELAPACPTAVLVGLGNNAEAIVAESQARAITVEGYDDDALRVKAWAPRVRSVNWDRVQGTEFPIIVTVCDDAGLVSRLRARRGTTLLWTEGADVLLGSTCDRLRRRVKCLRGSACAMHG